MTKLANQFARQFFDGETISTTQLGCHAHLLGWAASLHEIGISVAHSGYHKHTAYILANADMPGFSKKEQARLSLLTLAQRGNLGKLQGQLKNPDDFVLAMSLRLAVLFYRSRSDGGLPDMHGRFSGTKFHLTIDPEWLAQNPLTETALQDDEKQWKSLGIGLQIVARNDSRSKDCKLVATIAGAGPARQQKVIAGTTRQMHRACKGAETRQQMQHYPYDFSSTSLSIRSTPACQSGRCRSNVLLQLRRVHARVVRAFRRRGESAAGHRLDRVRRDPQIDTPARRAKPITNLA